MPARDAPAPRRRAFPLPPLRFQIGLSMSKQARDQQVHHPEVEGPHAHDDDLIVVPKGKSKTRFLLTFLLIIFLLTMFAISDEFVAVLTGQGGRGGAYVTWKHPTEGAKSLSQAEFLLEKQNVAKVWSIITGQNNRDRNDDDTAFFVVMSDVADGAGVHVTDSELRKIIAPRFQGVSYAQVLAGNRISVKEFENTLRRLLEVERYESLVAAPLATPDPAEVEKLWKARHQEHAFDYIELSAETLRTEAQAALPSDADLEAWFQALPENKREQFKRQTAVAGELAVFPLEGEHSPDLLFAKYPRPPDEDLDAAAREYYDNYSYVRFRNHNLPTDRQPTPEDFSRPFDEVKDIARREVAIFRSLEAWRSDLVKRTEAGETIDLAAEATGLGLLPHSQSSPLTQTEWTELDVPWASRNLAEFLIATAEPGKFIPAVSVDEKSLIVGRGLAKEEPRMPSFAEIKDRVADEWLRQRMSELAISKLEPVRAKLGTPPDPSDPAAASYVPEVDAAAFATAASDAGFQVQVRDYQERAKMATETPAQMYLRGASPLYSAKANSVLKPEIARDGKNSYLVRVAGLRDADVSKMSPAEYQGLGEQVVREALVNFKNRTFTSKEFMKERYAVWLRSWEPKPEKAAN